MSTAFSLSIVERGFDVRLERLYCSRDAFYTKFVSGPQGRDETERAVEVWMDVPHALRLVTLDRAQGMGGPS